MVVCIQPVLFLKFWLIYKVRICMGHLTCSSVPFSCRGLCNDLSLYYYTHIRYSIFNIFLLLSLFYFSLLHVMILHSYFSIDNYEYLLHNITEFLLLYFFHMPLDLTVLITLRYEYLRGFSPPCKLPGRGCWSDTGVCGRHLCRDVRGLGWVSSGKREDEFVIWVVL